MRAAAGGTLDTLWQYSLPSFPNLSSLDMSVQLRDGEQADADYWHSNLPKYNVRVDVSTGFLAMVLKRMASIDLKQEIDSGRAKATYYETETEINGFACFQWANPTWALPACTQPEISVVHGT